MTPFSPSNEHRLISKLIPFCGKGMNPAFTMGIGDDCAVRTTDGAQHLYSSDISVENVHFSRNYMSLKEIGYKSIVTNLSDIAAMGGTADSLLVQIVFPKNSIEDEIIELYKGFSEAIANWDVPIVGGDLSKGDSWIIAVTVIGRVHQRPIYRSGAKRGESVWCTGTPGMSSIGLCLLQKYGREMAEAIGKKYVDAHVRPTPRLTEGEQLLPFATSMMDLSDGIAKDLKTIAWESGVSIKIVIPEVVEQNLSHGATLTPLSLEHHFLNGGEEYELLFTTSSEFNPNNFPFQLYKIGEVVDGPKGELILSRKGESSVVSTGGWDHC